jgi:predicted phage terminase large subunit-like protein
VPATLELPEAVTLESIAESDLGVDLAVFEENAAKFGQESFTFFCWYYMRHHLTDELAEYHLKVMRSLEGLMPGRHLELLLPREHGKSTLVSLCFLMWNIVYRKKRHILLVSSTSENAQKFLGKINQELRSNELIRRDFGDLTGSENVGRKEVWKASKLKTANQVLVLAVGTNGSVRGANESLPENLQLDFVEYDRHGRPRYKKLKSFRPDLVLLDDVIEDKWVLTKHVRDQTWNWFWKSLYNTMDRDRGNCVVVGTTLHDDDLVSRLFRDPVQTMAWKKIKMPACEGFDQTTLNPINCLWPAAWQAPDLNKPVNRKGELIPLDELDNWPLDDVFYLSKLYWKRIEIGERAFAQEFLLDPLSDSFQFFKRQWFRYFIMQESYFTAEAELALTRLGHEIEVLPDDLIVVTAIDPAGTRQEQVKEGADPDYTCICTVGYSPRHRRFYILDICRERISALRQQEVLMEQYRKFSSEFAATGTDGSSDTAKFNFTHMGILVESVAYQKALATMLDEIAPALGMYPRIVEVKRGRRDKTTRATGVSPLFERRTVVWPEQFDLKLKKRDVEEAMDELDRFPQGDHDDCVDAVVDALAFLNRMSLSLNRGLNALNVMRAMVKSSPEMYAFVSKREDEGMDFQDASAKWAQYNREHAGMTA